MIWTINFKTNYIFYFLFFFLGQNKGKGGKNNMSGGKGGAHGKTFLIFLLYHTWQLLLNLLKTDKNFRPTSEPI